MLLVGGDSFAQFPKQWYQCESDEEILNPVPEFSQSLNFKHWGQLLADQGNMESKSVGIGAGDISTTTAVTMQALERHPVTHCIFFITTFPRSVVQRHPNREFAMYEVGDVLHNTDYNKFYTDEKLFVNNMTRRHEDTSGERLLGEDWWHNDSAIQGPYKVKISNHLECIVPNSALHDKWCNLIALANSCEKKNIKLFFVTPFADSISAKTFLLENNYNHFDYMPDLYGDWVNFRENIVGRLNFKWLRTHHTEQQHFEIANHFNKCFPNWLDK